MLNLLKRPAILYVPAFVFYAATLLPAQVTTLPAPVPNLTQTFDFGPVGLGASETAEVNIANTATAMATGATPSCKVTVSFLNSSGTALTASTPAPSSFPVTVASGQIISVTLPGASAGFSGTRGAIRATVTLTRTAGENAPCSLQASFETFDSSGNTHVHVQLPQASAILPIVRPLGNAP